MLTVLLTFNLKHLILYDPLKTAKALGPVDI